MKSKNSADNWNKNKSRSHLNKSDKKAAKALRDIRKNKNAYKLALI